jgi:hypothetical protein
METKKSFTPKNKLKRRITLAVLAVIISTSFVIIYQKYVSLSPELAIYFNQSEASVTSNKYKEYKAKYKNDTDKNNYFIIKELRKKQPLIYWRYKFICDVHKSDSDVQFKKLPVATQGFCTQYYSYKGYEKYVYYRDKYRASQKNNDDEDENETSSGPWNSQDDQALSAMQSVVSSASRCFTETDPAKRLNIIDDDGSGNLHTICSVGSNYPKWPDLTTGIGWLTNGAGSPRLNRQELVAEPDQVDGGAAEISKGWYWCTAGVSYSTYPKSCGFYNLETKCGADNATGSFCFALKNDRKFIWCTKDGCQREIAPWTSQDEQALSAMQTTVSYASSCMDEADSGRKLNPISDNGSGILYSVCNVGSYPKWPDLTTTIGWLTNGTGLPRLNRQQLVANQDQVDGTGEMAQGWYWCTANTSYTRHPSSCGFYSVADKCGADTDTKSFCYALKKDRKFIWCTEDGCQKKSSD